MDLLADWQIDSLLIWGDRYPRSKTYCVQLFRCSTNSGVQIWNLTQVNSTPLNLNQHLNQHTSAHFVFILFLIQFNLISISFLLASSPRSSSPIKYTRPLVAVLKSSHSRSFFSFVADEELRGQNILLLTSFLLHELLRYLRESCGFAVL